MLKLFAFAMVAITLGLSVICLMLVQELEKAVLILPALMAIMVTVYYETIDVDLPD